MTVTERIATKSTNQFNTDHDEVFLEGNTVRNVSIILITVTYYWAKQLAM